MTLLRTAFGSLQFARQALAAGLASLVLLGAGAAWADPPARAGRIAEVAGTVWLYDLDTQAWVRVQRNQTIGQGDQLRTDTRSRLTLRVGSSTVWLDEQSDLEVLQLDDNGLALRLAAGDVALRLRTAEAAQETRVQTREGVISPEMEGLFRVDQLDRGSRVGVLQGRAQFDSDPGAPVQRAWLREGEQAEFWSADTPRIERQTLVRDQFSAWFMDRDKAEAGLAVGNDAYVSPEMTGAEDLNQYGNWEAAAEYGNVWIPSRVAVGWEPYRDGRWVWTSQWGWSWVDNSPWGFAPFHYGRWVQYRSRWAWAPGRFEPRPAYAPALVAWTGGAGVSIGVTIGGVRRPPQTGWVPLAPRQNFVPVYPHSPRSSERFQWNRPGPGRGDRDHNDRNDRYDRNPKPTPARGDAGPQPYRPLPGNNTTYPNGTVRPPMRQVPEGPAPTPSYGNGNPGNPNMPWNRTDNGENDRRQGNRGERDSRAPVQRNPQSATTPVQPTQPAQVLPNQPVNALPQMQGPQPVNPREYRDYRNNRNPRDNRDNFEDRGNERPQQRNREPAQQSPAFQQAVPQAAAMPQPQRPAQQPQQVPIFNNQQWPAGAPSQRQTGPQVTPAAQPPAALPPAPQQRQQARAVDEEKPNGKRNKREAQENDLR